MSMEIDGAGVLKAIAHDPSRFGMQASQLNALAVHAVRGRLIEKNLTLDLMRSVYDSIGHANFAAVIDSLNEKDTKVIIKIDSKNPDCKSADDRWLKSHLLKLASSEADLTLAPVKAKPPRKEAAQKPAKPKIGTIMASEAQAAATKVRKTRSKA